MTTFTAQALQVLRTVVMGRNA